MSSTILPNSPQTTITENVTLRRQTVTLKPKMAATGKCKYDLEGDGSLLLDSILSQDETNEVFRMLARANEIDDEPTTHSFCTSSQMGGADPKKRPSSPLLSPVMLARDARGACDNAWINNQSPGLSALFSSPLPLSNRFSMMAEDGGHSLEEAVINHSNATDSEASSLLIPLTAPADPGKLPEPVNPHSGEVVDPCRGSDILTQSAGDVLTPNNDQAQAVGDALDDTTVEHGDDEKETGTDDDDTTTEPDPNGEKDETILENPLINCYTDPATIARKMEMIDDMLTRLSNSSDGVNSTVMGLEKSLEFSYKEIKDLKKENIALKTRLEAVELEEKISQFQAKIVDDKLDRLETTTKKRNLIFEGVPEIDGKREEVDKTIGALFEQLGVQEGVNFDACFRMGPYNKSRTRPILVSFERQGDRDLLYARRMDLRRTRDFRQVWINEDLELASKRKRGIIRMIAKEALHQGIDCKTGKFSLRIDDVKYDEGNLEELPSCLHPSKLKQVRIDKDTLAYQSEFAPFSNFFPCVVKIGQHEFFCLEQAFQFMRAKILNKPLAATKIYLSRDVRFIKQTGTELGTSNEWEVRKYEVMFSLLRKKFDQHPELKALLLSTAGLELVEATPDRTWGCGATLNSNVLRKHEWPGKNKHGETLMLVRDKYLALEAK